jgi:hypothetical protein
MSPSKKLSSSLDGKTKTNLGIEIVTGIALGIEEHPFPLA